MAQLPTSKEMVQINAGFWKQPAPRANKKWIESQPKKGSPPTPPSTIESKVEVDRRPPKEKVNLSSSKEPKIEPTTKAYKEM